MARTRSFPVWLLLTLGGLAPPGAMALEAQEPPAAGGAVDTAFGLHTATFTTPQGTIKVHLPDDMAAGDSISGTVVADPAGQNESEKAQNQDELNGYVVELEKQPTPPGQGPGRWTIPIGVVQAIPVILKDPRGREVGRVRVPVEPSPNAPPPGGRPRPQTPRQPPRQQPQPPGMLQIPTVGQPGKPIEIRGAFDGNSEATGIRINGNEAQVLAESPRKAVVQTPADVVGQAEVEVSENGAVSRCRYRSVGVRLSAPKTTLTKGERTALTVSVRGLEGLDRPIALELANHSPGTVRVDGGDRQTLQISPAETTNRGTYAATRGLTGVGPGGFNITALVRSLSASVCESVREAALTSALDPGALPRVPGASPPLLEPRGPDDVPVHIQPPHSLRTTIDPKLCADKVPGGVLFCKTSIEKGDAILVWDWAPPIFPPEGALNAEKVDGYHVYKTAVGSVPVLVATQPDQRSQGQRFAYVTGDCYTVRAYFATIESADSNSFCLGPPEDRFETKVLPGIGHVTDPRTTIDHATYSCFPGTCGGMSMGLDAAMPPAGGLLAGFSWSYDNGTPPCNCWEGVDHYYWSAVTFDLVSIPDLEIRLQWADLKFVSTRRDCELVMGLTNVTGGSIGPIEPSFWLAGDPGPVAVTDSVNEILRGTSPPYFGFRSSEQGSRVGLEKENGSCLSTLTKLELWLTVLKKP